MATELVDGLWLLDLGLVRPFRSNAYLIDEARLGCDDALDHTEEDTDHRAGGGDDSGDRANGGDDRGNRANGGDERGDRASGGDLTLCDTGLWWNRPSVREELAHAGYGPGDLDRVLLTHYDLDHVGGLGRLLPEFDGPVYIGKPDYELLNGGEHPPRIHHKGLFHRVARRLFPLPAGLDLRPITDGERIGRFTAYLTPGHNPGHAVYVHDAGVALLGDLVWEDAGALTTPIRFDSYDMAELRESVRALSAHIGPFEVAAMGHGTPLVTDGDDALRALAEDL